MNALGATLADSGVPKEYLPEASAGAMRFLHALLDHEEATGEEWRRQRCAAFPHTPGEGPLARFCLTCSDAFPCAGYTREVNE